MLGLSVTDSEPGSRGVSGEGPWSAQGFGAWLCPTSQLQRDWGERLGCETGASAALRPSPARLAAQATITGEGCDRGRYSPLRDALEPKNLILNQSVAFWKTSSLHARPLADDEFAISLGNRTW